MADFSDTRLSMALFQQLESDRKSDKAPHATGSLEITVADLNEFFSLALALKPVDNWKGEPCIKLPLRRLAPRNQERQALGIHQRHP